MEKKNFWTNLEGYELFHAIIVTLAFGGLMISMGWASYGIWYEESYWDTGSIAAFTFSSIMFVIGSVLFFGIIWDLVKIICGRKTGRGRPNATGWLMFIRICRKNWKKVFPPCLPYVWVWTSEQLDPCGSGPHPAIWDVIKETRRSITIRRLDFLSPLGTYWEATLRKDSSLLESNICR